MRARWGAGGCGRRKRQKARSRNGGSAGVNHSQVRSAVLRLDSSASDIGMVRKSLRMHLQPHSSNGRCNAQVAGAQVHMPPSKVRGQWGAGGGGGFVPTRISPPLPSNPPHRRPNHRPNHHPNHRRPSRSHSPTLLR
jgi:hypothetical protein